MNGSDLARQFHELFLDVIVREGERSSIP
jgi:hypothetical protein